MYISDWKQGARCFPTRPRLEQGTMGLNERYGEEYDTSIYTTRRSDDV